MSAPLRIVVLGLSLSSSWGNGHATTYRALLKALAERGHDVLFLERVCKWYADNYDLRFPDFCRLAFYENVGELRRFAAELNNADVVMVGSYVPDGIEIGRQIQRTAASVKVFYDIDTPVTLSELSAGKCGYLSPDLIRNYDLYLSFSGGPILQRIESLYGAQVIRALYCSVDTDNYKPLPVTRRWDLGYLGTYSRDRQPVLGRLLLETARRAPDLRFVVAGSQYPSDITWPDNVEQISHLPPAEHARFYSNLRWTLNVTRADMVRAGFSPSVRIFEAGACGCPIISDAWEGIGSVLTPSKEILLAETSEDVLRALRSSERMRTELAQAARSRILREHSARSRARELEGYLLHALENRKSASNAKVLT